MPNDDATRLTEEEAARLWKRAAELQAEAARRLEERARSSAEGDLSDDTEDEGYALVHVRSAAEEAGISPEFVDAALAELDARSAVGHDRTGIGDGFAASILGDAPEMLEARRFIDASPEEIYRTMQQVFPGTGFGLILRDVRGGEVLEGGVLIFDVPAMTGMSYTPFQYEAWWADVKQVMASIHPLQDDPPRCEVIVRASMKKGRRLNTWIGLGVSGAAGAGGAAGGVGAGMAIASVLGITGAILAPAVGILALGTGGMTAGLIALGYRKLYRYGLGRGQRALEGLLGALNLSATAGWGTGQLPPSSTAHGDER